MLLDAADRPGGRVATDVVDGFRCDRGFQVLNTSYPALRAAADLDALDLRSFTPAAAVRGVQQHDVQPPAAQQPGRAQPGEPGADHDDVVRCHDRSSTAASASSRVRCRNR